MDLLEAMAARHSVRRYLDKPIEQEKINELLAQMRKGNEEAGLHFQLVLNEPEAFKGPLAHYGSFRGVKNYFVAVGPEDRDEAIGYYGEKLVLLAQSLGLNTCWVALTFRKSKVPAKIAAGEKLYVVIALGYGETQGTPHKNKDIEKHLQTGGLAPYWFRKAVEAAMMAPTAVNQQKFRFTLDGDRVWADAPKGKLTALDLGIVKYHFELGAGDHPFTWG